MPSHGDLRLQLATFQPDITNFAADHQAYPSNSHIHSITFTFFKMRLNLAIYYGKILVKSCFSDCKGYKSIWISYFTTKVC